MSCVILWREPVAGRPLTHLRFPVVGLPTPSPGTVEVEGLTSIVPSPTVVNVHQPTYFVALAEVMAMIRLGADPHWAYWRTLHNLDAEGMGLTLAEASRLKETAGIPTR